MKRLSVSGYAVRCHETGPRLGGASKSRPRGQNQGSSKARYRADARVRRSPRYATRMSGFARATIIPACRNPCAYRSRRRAEVLHGGGRTVAVRSTRCGQLAGVQTLPPGARLDGLAGSISFVPIEDEVERTVRKRELEAVGANYLDPKMRQRSFGNWRVHGQAPRDGASAIRLAKFPRESRHRSLGRAHTRRLPGAPSLVVCNPTAARVRVASRNAVKVPSDERRARSTAAASDRQSESGLPSGSRIVCSNRRSPTIKFFRVVSFRYSR